MMNEMEQSFQGRLCKVESMSKDVSEGHIVHILFQDGIKGRVIFLEEGIFRYDVSPDGQFESYAKPREEEHTAKIQQYPDESDAYAKPEAKIIEDESAYQIVCGNTAVIFDKSEAKMKIRIGEKTVMEESEALTFTGEETIQTIIRKEEENFYGGGTQNGRFVHTGKTIQIVNESAWMDGGVASPNPFYYTTGGYGVLRNTFSDGSYDFGETEHAAVRAAHKENRLSAYYFVSGQNDGRTVTQELLRHYYHVTGNPMLLPEYGFYEGHLNCYNRDSWSDESGAKAWNVKGTDSHLSEGKTRYESGMATGYRLSEGQHSESLNGEQPTVATEHYPANVDTPYEYSARAVLDEYIRYDMPLGYFLPNDGYGGGYGQNGYYVQGGVNEDGSSSEERIAAVDANVENLAKFTEYANSKGVASGLWTESNLSPDSDPQTYWHLLRDFRKEVTKGGATTLKTDVAWVGPGYSFQLNGVKTAYDVITTSQQFRPNIISLDGWAGSQRFNSVWSGDQTGGNWEYIRFHIPTYIGSSLSGNPNIGSDMDGIFGGKALIAARDYQWKSFTPQMLNMDGWGSYMKAPFTFGDPYTGINRMYMKKKSELMPYIYTCAASAANLDTGNDDTGLPMVRAMFLEYPNDDYAYSRSMQYQFMLGSSILVAPVYQNIAADEMGNDVRNHIYLPDKDQIWIDYLTGEKYEGGQVINNFAAPLWKLPVFVKNGAILPMYEENNTPDEICKENRIVEFWPAGFSRYTVYEDDGKYITNETKEDEAYGTIDHVSYGSHVSTTYTANVEGTTATLTAEPSVGEYEGYEAVRNTTFIVNLSQKPEYVEARSGSENLHMTEAASKEAFDAAKPEAHEAVFFYDPSPKLETYASAEEKEFEHIMADVRTAPKLYVKMAPVDTQKEEQTVVVGGYVNEIVRKADKENANLPVPVLSIPEDKKTASSIWLEWTKAEGATSYEMLVDGQLYAMGDHASYLHDELEYNSAHTYCVRARNTEGYSRWSEEVTTSSLSDPWRNEIGASGTITWTGSDEAGPLKYATDHSFRGLFFSADDVVGGKIPFIYDFGAAYELDKFEYYPRDSYGSGTVQRMNVYSSLDGRNWKLEWNGAEQEEWTYNTDLEVEENAKTVPLNGVLARYVKLEIVQSIRNFFASHELPVYKKDGTKPFAVGSTNKNAEVSEGDYTNMKNYLGTSVKDGSNFVDQIQKRGGDINNNGIYDVYDYAYTMFKLDGGTKQSGTAEGQIRLVPDKEAVKAGETFAIAVQAEEVSNLNAYGKVLHYDPAKLEFVSVDQEKAAEQMENLTVNKVYSDGTAYVNLAFANRGDKPLYNGSGQLSVITMKALTDLNPKEEMELENVLLLGPDIIK
ncbi:MAG: TIM-barrel domain-containing protein [Sellimonas sp.]|uniref:TIM-barrel domain-containing protein n=1 Tax=Sellimonas sp. TaxID=2021466 RepID=UPI00399FD1CB